MFDEINTRKYVSILYIPKLLVILNYYFKGSNEYFSDKKFKLKYRLGRHILTHEQRLELCPVCGKGFATKSRARIHVRFVHNKEPRKRLKCHECEYTSLKKERLKYHIKSKYLCLFITN